MALVISLQGPAEGSWAWSESSRRLAMEEMNAEGGVLGRELKLVPVTAVPPRRPVAANVDALILGGAGMRRP